MKTIDLRSDTVTQPTAEIREAMAAARVGDDVFGEDPTINELESLAAETFHKEAALLVPSGTMANLVAVLTHCQRGDEVILGNKAHTFYYEGGGIAAFGGVHPHTLPNNEDGTIDPERILHAIRPDDVHFPPTRLIALENTHNKCFGTPITIEYMESIRNIAREHGLKIHVDGARIFNAAVAQGVDVWQLTEAADSVSFCLSKGLSAPVGSLICGGKEFIRRARRIRKALGGGMRQAGIIAAAGIVALKTMPAQLSVDHQNANRLAEGIARMDGLSINLNRVNTNIVYFELTRDDLPVRDFLKRMEEKGVRFFDTAPRQFRMVTHYGIEEEDIEYTLKALESVVK